MENVVIIGSGCAGWTAAIYAARANLRPLLVTGQQPGGLLTTTSLVENFPGFSKGVNAVELMTEMQDQAKRFGAKVEYMSKVESVDLSRSPFTVVVDGDSIKTKTIIVAVGAGHKRLAVPGETELECRGVTYCATCDGALPMYRDKPVVVVGGGDSACEEASYLTRFASKVYLVHRRGHLRASKIMIQRVLGNPKIELVWDTVIEEVLDVKAGKVTGVKTRNLATGASATIEASGLFVAIGHKPNTSLFQDALAMDENGYIKLYGGSQTSIPGVFAAGDCADHVYRQAITAAGMGCAAAIDAERFLATQDSEIQLAA